MWRYLATEERPHNAADDSGTLSQLSSLTPESPTNIAVAGSQPDADRADIAGREGDANSDMQTEDTDGVVQATDMAFLLRTRPFLLRTRLGCTLYCGHASKCSFCYRHAYVRILEEA